MPNLCIIPARALKDPEITPSQLRVLLAVGTFTSRDGSGVWASNATLAEVAGLHVRHMRDALKALVERGYVRKISRPGRTAIMAIVLDDPLEEPCTKSVQGGSHETRAGGCTKSVQRTTHITTPVIEPPRRVRDLLVADHHREALDQLLTAHPRSRSAIEYELRLRAEGGERPGFGLVAAAGWARVGEALHQMVASGRAFSARTLGTFLEGLDPLPSVTGGEVRLKLTRFDWSDDEPDILAKVGL